MAKQDGRQIARANDERALKALFKFGWLRTRDLAALLFMPKVKGKGKDFKPVEIQVTPTARRMAQRTMQRLRQRHQVIWIKAPDGSIIYGLSEAGARQLVDLGIPAKSAKDQIRRVSLSFFHHRRIANELAIVAILQGYRVASEHEIAKGHWLGGKDGIAGKKPDVVVRDQRQRDDVFLEVERSARNKAGKESLLEFLLTMWPDDEAGRQPAALPDGHRLHRVIFIATPAFIERLYVDLRNAGWSENLIVRRIGAAQWLYVTEGKYITYEDKTELATHA